MHITQLETFLTNAGSRNYLFILLKTDTGLAGLGEASLEWQVVGVDPFDREKVIGRMIRDQYQGGSTIMTAISGVEVALWDIIGKAFGQPVYKLFGGRCHEHLPAYANGWYGGAKTPEDFAERARDVIQRGYRALKFDPFWNGLENDGA